MRPWRVGSVLVVLAVQLCVAAPTADLPAALLPVPPDPSVRPQDDYYTYVNGQWLSQTPIPPQWPWYGVYVAMNEVVQNRLREIIESAARKDNPARGGESQVGVMFRSFTDEARINSVGIRPLRQELSRIDALRRRKDLPGVLARFTKLHTDWTLSAQMPATVPWMVGVWPDDRDASRWLVRLEPGGLGLPDRAFYLTDEAKFAKIRDEYRAHVTTVLQLSGDEYAAGDADAVLRFETQLARLGMPKTQTTDPLEAYNVLSVRQLQALMPHFKWQSYLQEAHLSRAGKLRIFPADYFRGLDDLLAGTDLSVWRAYLRWQLLRHYSPYLSREFAAADFEFYGHTLFGNERQQSRAELGVISIDRLMPQTVGYLYVQRYFDSRDKASVEAIAGNVRTAFHQAIEHAQWMEPSTRAAALEKLEAMLIKIGSPRQSDDIDTVRLDPHSLLENVMALSSHEAERRAARLGHLVDRRIWFGSPQEPDAYYNQTTNDIVVPAGYLLPPLFSSDAGEARNYGGIGTVIGHEMGHAFDDRGSQYDSRGNLRNWWSAQDHKEFADRIGRLARQYSNYSPLPGTHINGQLTLTENTADLIGLTLGFRALRLAVQARGSEAVPEQAQREFFAAWATRFRARYREQLLTRILITDGHSPGQYRCNGPLSNFDPFYTLFDVKEGDRLYRPPSDRVTLW
jgi:putative endopeptidase